jgi:hypothetical protein
MRYSGWARGAVLVALAAGAWAQDQTTERLKAEATKARTFEGREPADVNTAAEPVRQALAAWIESRLPEKRRTLAGEWESLAEDLNGALAGLGLKTSDTGDQGYGYAGVATEWFPELPDVLFVVASVSIPCGTDDTVYGYRFTPQGRTRILENHPKAAFGYRVEGIELSEPDAEGRRLLLTKRVSTQCASAWMMLAYDVYRFGSGAPREVLSQQHSLWMGNDGPELVLEPDHLWVELLDASVDGGIHNRTQIHSYDLSGASARRVGPVALQPQDFAEEWMTGSWDEVGAMPDAATVRFHEQVASDYLSGEYMGLGSCDGQRGITVVGMRFDEVGEKTFDPPFEAYLRVRDLGGYHYRMEGVTDSLPSGCRTSGSASMAHPWLTPAQLKALR